MGRKCCSLLCLHVWSVLILIVAGWNTVWADFRDGEPFDIAKITPMAILNAFQELPLESLFYIYFDTVLNEIDFSSSEKKIFDYEAGNFLLTKGRLATVGVIDQNYSHGYDEDTLHSVRRFNKLSYQISTWNLGSHITMCQDSTCFCKNSSKRVSLVSTLPIFANIVEQYYFKREEFEDRGVGVLSHIELTCHMTGENKCHNHFTIKNIVEDILQRIEEHHDQKALQLWRDLHTIIKPKELWGGCDCCQQGLFFQGNTWCGVVNFLTLEPVTRKIFGQQEESKKQRYIRLCKKYHENSASCFLSTKKNISPLYFHAIECMPRGCKSIALIKERTQWHIAQLQSIKKTANMLCVGTASIASFCAFVGLAKRALGI